MVERIGKIENIVGCLIVKEENGKFYWAIEDIDHTKWEEIPKQLYSTLIRYELKREIEQNKKG